MQKWEYKRLKMVRGFDAPRKDEAFQRATDFSMYVDTAKVNGELDELLAELGEQGWELVGISGRSDYLGGIGEIRGAAMGSTNGSVPDFAGMTTSETWMFKRPKL